MDSSDFRHELTAHENNYVFLIQERKDFDGKTNIYRLICEQNRIQKQLRGYDEDTILIAAFMVHSAPKARDFLLPTFKDRFRKVRAREYGEDCFIGEKSDMIDIIHQYQKDQSVKYEPTKKYEETPETRELDEVIKLASFLKDTEPTVISLFENADKAGKEAIVFVLRNTLSKLSSM